MSNQEVIRYRDRGYNAVIISRTLVKPQHELGDRVIA